MAAQVRHARVFGGIEIVSMYHWRVKTVLSRPGESQELVAKPGSTLWHCAGDARLISAGAYAILQVGHPTVGAGAVTPLLPQRLRNVGPSYLRWRREAIARGEADSTS